MPNASSHCSARILAILIGLLAMLAFTACTNTKMDAKASADKSARRLLAKYNLHPVGEPKLIKARKELLEDKMYEHFFKIEADASRDIGLNLDSKKGRPLDRLAYALKERNQCNKGRIIAYFAFDDIGKIHSAYLVLEGYAPGIVSLKDRYHFYPEGLKPGQLSLGKVEKIVLAGPWGEKSWEKTATINKPDEVSAIVKLLERCAAKKGSHPGPTIGDEEFGILLYFKSGSVVRTILFTENSEDVLKVDIFLHWHYSPPQELKTHVISILQR